MEKLNLVDRVFNNKIVDDVISYGAPTSCFLCSIYAIFQRNYMLGATAAIIGIWGGVSFYMERQHSKKIKEFERSIEKLVDEYNKNITS